MLSASPLGPPWANRGSLVRPALNGGVYLWARFEGGAPPGAADPLHRGVIYVGQCGGSFKSRWEKFDDGVNNPRKAKQSPKGYPRASRYLEEFGTDVSCLYVATLPVENQEKVFLTVATWGLFDLDTSRTGNGVDPLVFLEKNDDLLVKYAERRWILLYAMQHGVRPVINVE